MKKTVHILVTAACTAMSFALTSCSSSTDGGSNNSFTPIKVQFKSGATAQYELLAVDTTDIIDPVGGQYNITETVVDTNHNFGGYSSGVTMSVFATTPADTGYYYQDASGNLYRYNYGFSILNTQYPQLITYLGSAINVGWVLVSKPGAPAGTTWIAASDSEIFQSLGTSKIYLKDVATTMSDTTFIIASDSVKSGHVRHDVTASTAPGAGQTTGEIIIDTYISPSLGMTVEDFFHHSKISGLLLNGQQKGSFKLMTAK